MRSIEPAEFTEELTLFVGREFGQPH